MRLPRWLPLLILDNQTVKIKDLAVIKFKHQIPKKDELSIRILLQELTDVYSDFYITKNNLRLYIKENPDLLFKHLKEGDKICYDQASGMAFISGFSDEAFRKYVKIIAKNLEVADKLIKILIANINCDLYAKIKKNNPLKNILLKNGFRFKGDRGREILLVRHNFNKKGDSNANEN